MEIKRFRGIETELEDLDFVLELLMRKKYVEKLEKIIAKIRKVHNQGKDCSICSDIEELDRFYSKAKKLWD